MLLPDTNLKNRFASLAICIPTHNPRLDFLAELMQDVAHLETLLPLEVVISDDMSVNIGDLEEFIRLQPFPVRLIRSDERLGMTGNWNKCVSSAQAKYVLVTGQDDRFDPHSLCRAVNLLINDELELLFGNEEYIDEVGETLQHPSMSLRRLSIPRDSHPPQADRAIAAALILGNYLGDPCNAIFSRDLFHTTKGFSNDFSHAVDLEQWLRFLEQGPHWKISSISFAKRRIHSQNATVSHIASGLAAADRFRLLRQFNGVLVSDYEVARARYRLILHSIHDDIMMRRIPKLPFSVLEGSERFILSALTDAISFEIGLNLRCGNRPTERWW